MGRLRNHVTGMVFNRWCAFVKKIKTNRRTVHSVVCRMHAQRQWAAVDTWLYVIRTRRHIKTALQRTVGKWRNKLMASALRRWEYAHQVRRTHKSLAQRWRNWGLSRALARWRLSSQLSQSSSAKMSLEAQLQALRAEVIEQKKMAATALQQRGTADHARATVEARLSAMEKELGSASQYARELEDSSAAARAARQRDAESLQSQMASRDEEIGEMSSKLRRLESELVQRDKSCDNLAADNERLESAFAEVSGALKELRGRLDDEQRQRQSLEHSLVMKHSEVDDAERRNAKAEELVRSMEEKHVELRRQLQNGASRIATQDEQLQQMERLKREVALKTCTCVNTCLSTRLSTCINTCLKVTALKTSGIAQKAELEQLSVDKQKLQLGRKHVDWTCA